MNKRQQKLLDESLAILQALDFPRAQKNERSALTLLALLNLTPPKTWKDAESPMLGIRAILDFCRADHEFITFCFILRKDFHSAI